ncbi:MAG: hypothetical protein RLZZ353_875 [Actinomycetota bacterium]|jgi:uncharacterized membrane protein YhaH (DUF805 family)
MGPVDAIRSGFQRAVDLRGRSTRPEYWWWSLMTYVITLLVGDRPSTLEALALLALFVPSLAVTFRRLHDTDRSAWNLLWVLVPVLGVIALLVFLVQRGTPTSNRYGPPPSGTAGAAGPAGGWDAPPPPPPPPAG